MITMPASFTGAAQTGFTSPTYTMTVDSVDARTKQSVVTALGGTQAGVTLHSMSSPFSIAFRRPEQFQQLGKPNPITGLIASVPNNTFSVVTRKGVTPLADQPIRPAVFRSEFQIPAGSDVADSANLRAALSLHIGALNQLAASWGDTTVNGVL